MPSAIMRDKAIFIIATTTAADIERTREARPNRALIG